MKTMTLAEFHAACKAQAVGHHKHIAMRCPICHTLQSAQDLIAAGAGADFEQVEQYVGFSCVGRFTNAGAHQPGRAPGAGCNWTLGGLFQLHTLEVITDDGKRHPRFELATPAEAQAHAARAQEAHA